MRLTEILKPQNIKIPLQAQVKNEAIGELVNLLADNGALHDQVLEIFGEIFHGQFRVNMPAIA